MTGYSVVKSYLWIAFPKFADALGEAGALLVGRTRVNGGDPISSVVFPFMLGHNNLVARHKVEQLREYFLRVFHGSPPCLGSVP